MQQDSNSNGFHGIKLRNIVIAVFIGLSVSGYLIWRSFDVGAFMAIKWETKVILFILLAMLLMILRHFAYMLRVWLVTNKELTFKQSFDTIVLWEFASAATPSTVGGAAFAMFILNREKIGLGRSTAAVMAITFMDNLFFVIFSGILFIITGAVSMFALNTDCSDSLDIPALSALGGIPYIFMAGFLIALAITVFIGVGIFINPYGIKNLITTVFSIRFLSKWKDKAAEVGEEIITTSQEYNQKPFYFWLKIFLITTLAWTFKYFVVNSVLTAFGSINLLEQVVIMSRVLTMWVIMYIPFTPGASGVAEVAFLALMCTFVPAGLAATLTLLWRILTYYPYLILGIIVMPRWLKRVYIKPKK